MQTTASDNDDDFNLYSKPGAFWSTYHECRPAYPDELFQLIFEYHDSHTKDTSLAIDYGTGLGTILPNLLEKFDRVVGLDKNKEQLEIGTKVLQDKYGKDRVSMKMATAGQFEYTESASLITAAEAVHWFNLDAWMKESSRLLISGGTLAFWFYPPRCVIVGCSEAAQQTLSLLFHQFMYPDHGKYAAVIQLPAAITVYQLDNVEVNSGLYYDEERHKWQYNEERTELTCPSPNCKSILGEVKMKIGREAKIIDHPVASSGPFVQRKNWKIQNLIEYMDSLGLHVDMKEFLARSDIKEIIKKLEVELGGPDCTFDAAWWLSLVLATKR